MLLARWLPHPHARLLVVVGFLGGYTTFSSFSFESLALWERGELGLCLAYMGGSVAAGFAAVVLGTALGRELTLPRAERAARPTRSPRPQVAEPGGSIMIPTEAQLLSIHVGANERHNGKRLYEAIVETARAMKLAGASVFPVEMSYGGHRQIHDVLSDYTFIELPVLIEIVDAPERVDGLLVRARHDDRSGDGDDRARTGRSLFAYGGSMIIEGSVQKLTIYIGSQDTWHGRNLGAAIIERCRAQGLAGATMTRGNMGFGKNSLIHRAHLLGLSDDMPERIEVIDRHERIAEVLPILEEMVGAGLIVVQDVQVIQYRHDAKAKAEPS